MSLKKRHKLYATILTDLSDPDRPEVLAVAEGRDEAAARKCLEKLAPAQREGVQAYRADMGPAFHAACRELLPNATPVVDRFHVAKRFNEAIDGQRKKNGSSVFRCNQRQPGSQQPARGSGQWCIGQRPSPG